MSHDEGSITPLLPVVVLMMLMLGGLVVDGSRDLQARGDAQGYAEEAARAGATGIDPVNAKLALDTGTDARSVPSLVAAYCSAVMSSNPRVTSCGLAQVPYTPATVPPDCAKLVQQPLVVHTEVKIKMTTTLLGIVGIQALTASGAGSAKPYEGTNRDNAC